MNVEEIARMDVEEIARMDVEEDSLMEVDENPLMNVEEDSLMNVDKNSPPIPLRRSSRIRAQAIRYSPYATATAKAPTKAPTKDAAKATAKATAKAPTKAPTKDAAKATAKATEPSATANANPNAEAKLIPGENSNPVNTGFGQYEELTSATQTTQENPQNNTSRVALIGRDEQGETVLYRTAPMTSAATLSTEEPTKVEDSFCRQVMVKDNFQTNDGLGKNPGDDSWANFLTVVTSIVTTMKRLAWGLMTLVGKLSATAQAFVYVTIILFGTSFWLQTNAFVRHWATYMMLPLYRFSVSVLAMPFVLTMYPRFRVSFYDALVMGCFMYGLVGYGYYADKLDYAEKCLRKESGGGANEVFQNDCLCYYSTTEGGKQGLLALLVVFFAVFVRRIVP